MASRTREIVDKVAAELGVPIASTDWRATLAEVRPDLVAVGTPGGTHVEMVGAALELGCHVIVEKPLAPTAAEAKSLYLRARTTGVKTAYAASFRYQPAALLTRELVAAGAIGSVYEVECVSHAAWPSLVPFGWVHRLDAGGGQLNNHFPHRLAIVLMVLGGSVLAAMGESRNDLRRAPAGPHLHDFRDFAKKALPPAMAAARGWREVDSDWSYTVIARIGLPGSNPDDGVSASFSHAALRTGRLEDYIAFYGEKGTIHISGSRAEGGVYLGSSPSHWREVPIPQRITEGLPAVADDVQRNWTQLAREFVADVRGTGHAAYLTFRDGWQFQEVIEIAHSGRGWTALPDAT